MNWPETELLPPWQADSYPHELWHFQMIINFGPLIRRSCHVNTLSCVKDQTRGLDRLWDLPDS
jgi:hypothetical protein